MASVAMFAPGYTAQAEPLVVESAFVRLNEDVEVPARQAGALAEIAIQEGATVERGQLLGIIDDRDAKLEVERADAAFRIADRQAEDRSQVIFAKSAMESAERELQRAQRAREAVPGSVSQSEIERLAIEMERREAEFKRLEQEHAVARLTAKLRQSELSQAKLRLELTQIDSPLGGTVVELYKHAGEWVEPGQPVARVLQMDPIRVEGFVPHAQIPEAGLRNWTVRVDSNETGEKLSDSGRIAFVDPEIEPTTGQVRIRAEIENPAYRIKPGRRVRLVIAPPETEADEEPSTGQGE
ncbi:efflux RND transporter periplasmic adaptor subunit [Stratiformator vulcanicus]|uniref:efflux RND transporter periplasmic adaptor subunit n=1 Tax=Stratiformator vulcanicus TaxID=2527980 RepID=UPI00287783C4|nr:HlyD family efflux transporter periplasmic adaptor subunit [Stratiformator vulcanicus]